jgi:hypothetical protein
MASLGFLRPEGRPFYGFDGPYELIQLASLAGICALVFCFLTTFSKTHEKVEKLLTESRHDKKRRYDAVRPLLMIGTLYWGAWAATYVYSSLAFKYAVADRMVSMVDWNQTRAVLDVGCGRGLLMNSVALAMKKVCQSLWYYSGDTGLMLLHLGQILRMNCYFRTGRMKKSLSFVISCFSARFEPKRMYSSRGLDGHVKGSIGGRSSQFC